MVGALIVGGIMVVATAAQIGTGFYSVNAQKKENKKVLATQKEDVMVHALIRADQTMASFPVAVGI